MSTFDDCLKKYQLFREQLSLIKERDRARVFFAEENVKNKIIIPLMQCLGWNLIRDLNFEYMRTDIILSDEVSVEQKDKATLIVEVKSWDEQVLDKKANLNQCLKYTYRLGTPWILLTSGKLSGLYSSLVNPHDLKQTKALKRFSFEEICMDKSDRLFKELYELVGKENFVLKNNALMDSVQKCMPNVSIKEAKDKFREVAAKFVPIKITHKLEEEDFMRSVAEQPKSVRDAFMLLRKAISVWHESDDKRVEIVLSSKSIGIGFRMVNDFEEKTLVLFGIYPQDAHVSFGLENWANLRLNKKLMSRMSELSACWRKEKTKANAEKIIQLITDALQDIIQKNK